MTLEQLHALWAEDDAQKMAIARKSGPAGVLMGEDGRADLVGEDGLAVGLREYLPKA